MNASNHSSPYGSLEIVGIAGTTILWVVEVPVHVAILWRISTGAACTLASDIFTLNLSMYEILYALFHLLYIITNSYPIYYFCAGLIFTGRPLFQSCICVERFMAVVHPVLFLKCKPLRYRVACSAAAWVLIVGFSLSYMLLLCATKAWVYVAEGQCLFFMSVMLGCSLAILRALKRAVPPGETGRDSERDTSIKRRAFVIVCLIMVSFLGNYFTWAVTIATFAAQGLNPSDEMQMAMYICTCVAMLSGCVHPLLYLCQKTGKVPCFKPIHGT